MDFTITSNQILWFCGFITGLYGVWKIVKEFRKPSNDLKIIVSEHSQLLKKDDERMKEIEDSNQKILKCLLVMINHEITGNGIEKMKQARDELQDYLINK